MRQIVRQNRKSRRVRLIPGLVLHMIMMSFLLLFGIRGQAQVKMPDMITPGDTWGIIDVNNMYGGCMQVDSYAGLLSIDVQFLKRGMLFAVYDYDGNNTNGLDTRVYMFLPASGVWSYNTPFEIPAANQGKTISSAGLESSLNQVDIGLSATASDGDVSYSLTDQKFYVFNGTDWVEIPTGGSTPGGATNPATANVGDVFYNTTDKILYVYDGTKWVEISTNGSTPGGATNPATANAGDVFYNTTDKTLYVYNGTVWTKIDGGDNLGNHTATQVLKMGSYSISNDGDSGDGVAFDATGNAVFGKDVTINGNLYTPSDERLKTHIETLTGVLEKIDQLRGVQFEYKDQKKYATGSKVGVVAQELQRVYPEMVIKGDDGYLKVDYTQLTGMLIQAVKEQQRQINALKTEVGKLQEQINEIRQKIR